PSGRPCSRARRSRDLAAGSSSAGRAPTCASRARSRRAREKARSQSSWRRSGGARSLPGRTPDSKRASAGGGGDGRGGGPSAGEGPWQGIWGLLGSRRKSTVPERDHGEEKAQAPEEGSQEAREEGRQEGREEARQEGQGEDQEACPQGGGRQACRRQAQVARRQASQARGPSATGREGGPGRCPSRPD